MLRVAVPNKGTLAEPASAMLVEAGYRQRHDAKDLTVIDAANEVEFFFLRPKDIAIYVGSGELDLGITGRDLAQDSEAPVFERLALGFGGSAFRYAAPSGRDWKVGDLDGLRVATAYPRLVRADLARHGVHAEVIRLDGAVEISVQLGVADVIADVVGSGRTLRQHGLAVFGDPICSSEAVLLEQADAAPSAEKAQ
ncbi:MAG: ATP phosphoribosyltransferase, partial [Pseudonocardiaceae bacterium]